MEIMGTGPKGTARRNLTIVAGKDKLALTPPMGWNSWNVWGLSVDSDKLKKSEKLLQKGYQLLKTHRPNPPGCLASQP